MSERDESSSAQGRHRESIAECPICLWHIVGCAEAYFDADTDDERAMAEAEFDRLVHAARAVERHHGRVPERPKGAAC